MFPHTLFAIMCPHHYVCYNISTYLICYNVSTPPLLGRKISYYLVWYFVPTPLCVLYVCVPITLFSIIVCYNFVCYNVSTPLCLIERYHTILFVILFPHHFAGYMCPYQFVFYNVATQLRFNVSAMPCLFAKMFNTTLFAIMLSMLCPYHFVCYNVIHVMSISHCLLCCSMIIHIFCWI